MDEQGKSSAGMLKHVQIPPNKTEPEFQIGGPQSGFPPPYIVGQDLAPYLIVGIDFGSYYCRVCTFAEGKPYSLQPHEFVALVENTLEINQTDMVHSLKSCLSTERMVKRGHEVYSPVELTSRTFRYLKHAVELSSQRLLAKAVISVPTCFNHRQRQNLISSAIQADISVLGLINETTAAALDAVYGNNLSNGYYLVVSQGAYSMESSVIHLQNRLLETKSATGSQQLSGHWLSVVLAEALSKEMENSEAHELIPEIEDVKRNLDHSGLSVLRWKGKQIEISRKQAKVWLKDFMQEMEQLLENTISSAGIEDSQIAGIVVSGAGTKFWLLREYLNIKFSNALKCSGYAAAGSAIQAALLVRQAKDWVVWDSIACPVFVCPR